MKTTNYYNDIFCRRLKQARLASGLSQKRLGIAAGIDEFVASTRINRYEKGVHEPNTDIVQKLSEVLRVPLAYFYAEDDDLVVCMDKFSIKFDVDISLMNYNAYYPWFRTWFFRKWFTNKPVEQISTPLTVRMFAESARAGRWLYE